MSRRQDSGWCRAPTRTARRARPRVEVHDLVQRVHAGIGAAGAHHRIGASAKARQRRVRVDPARCGRRLALPAVVAPAAVAEAEREARTGPRRARRPLRRDRSSMPCAFAFSAPEALATTSCSRSRAPSMSPIWRNSSASSSLRVSGSACLRAVADCDSLSRRSPGRNDRGDASDASGRSRSSEMPDRSNSIAFGRDASVGSSGRSTARARSRLRLRRGRTARRAVA